MNLLILASEEEELSYFENCSENVDYRSLADISVNSGFEPVLKIEDQDISEVYDAIYINPEPKATIYTRVLLEAVQEESINCNLHSNTFFIMAKKQYLFKVLKEKGINIPNTVAIPSQKGLTSIENNIEFPVVAKRYKNFREENIDKIEDIDALKSFSKRTNYGESYIVIQEFVEGDVFDSIYIDGEIISLKVEGRRWEKEEVTYSYHTISADQKERVKNVAESIGTPICRVQIIDDKIVQVKPRLDLPLFKKISGKNVFEKVCNVLIGDND